MTDLEIVRALAERGMGWTVVERPLNRNRHYDFSGPDVFMEIDGTFWRGTKPDGSATVPWRPLDSMDDAWGIVDKLKRKLWGMTLSQIEVDPSGRKRFHMDKWFCQFTGFDNEVESVASTPQRAIVLAALKVGKDKTEQKVPERPALTRPCAECGKSLANLQGAYLMQGGGGVCTVCHRGCKQALEGRGYTKIGMAK